MLALDLDSPLLIANPERRAQQIRNRSHALPPCKPTPYGGYARRPMSGARPLGHAYPAPDVPRDRPTLLRAQSYLMAVVHGSAWEAASCTSRGAPAETAVMKACLSV